MVRDKVRNTIRVRVSIGVIVTVLELVYNLICTVSSSSKTGFFWPLGMADLTPCCHLFLVSSRQGSSLNCLLLYILLCIAIAYGRLVCVKNNMSDQ